MKKISFWYYLILKILILFLTIYEFINGHDRLAIVFGIIFLLFLILDLFKNKIKFNYFFFVENILYLLIFVYEFNTLYKKIPYWDTALHGFTGFLATLFILLCFYFLKKKKKIKKLSSFIVIFLGFCFSLTIGVLFEIMEYSCDRLFSLDMQKDMFVDSLYTTKYDENEKKVRKIEDISKTVIYYGKEETFTIEGAYLDIGINDTMKDLYVNLIGAIMGSFYIFVILKRK